MLSHIWRHKPLQSARWTRRLDILVLGSDANQDLGVLDVGADLAIVTAHPFDISALRLQAAIKKIDCLPAYRLVLEPDEDAQELAVRRGKMIAVAMQMGPAGLPAREFEPRKEEFPCTYCPFRAKCIGDGADYGIALPEIPQDMRIKPAAELAEFEVA